MRAIKRKLGTLEWAWGRASASLWLFLGVVSVSSLSGCSDVPTVELAEKEVKWYFDKYKVKCVSFKKIDGQSREKDGVKHYVMDFEVEIEYLVNLSEGKNDIVGISPGRREGDRIKIRGTARFYKKESGWKGGGIDLQRVVRP